MPVNKTLMAEVAARFQEVQRTFSSHRKAAVLLRQRQDAATDTESFRAAFFACIERVLPVFKREPAVERVVAFVVQYCAGGTSATAANVPGNDAFALQLVRHLMAYSNAKDKGVRFRVCQIIAGVMAGLGEDAEIDDELWDELSARMLARVKDKIPIVRAEGARALTRLQDPNAADDAVVAEYLRLLSTDASKDVRKAALGAICVVHETLPAILQRTRDVSDAVRAFAFGVLANKVDVSQLSVAQRVYLLEQGCKDRVAAVREACVEMACVWLQSAGFDCTRLLGLLDVTDNEDTAALALTALFDRAAQLAGAGAAAEGLSFAARSLMDAVAVQPEVTAAALTPESALFVRVRCHWLRKVCSPPREDEVDALLPAIVDFAATLSDVVQRSTKAQAQAALAVAAAVAAEEEEEDEEEDDGEEASEAVAAAEHGAACAAFVARQLLVLAVDLDFADEVGRRRVVDVLLKLLGRYREGDTLVAEIMAALSEACRDELSCIRAAVEVASGLMDADVDGDGDGGAAAGAAPDAEAAARLAEVREQITAAQETLAEFEEMEGAEADAAEMRAVIADLRATAAEIEAEGSEEEAQLRHLRALCVTRALLRRTRRTLAVPELRGLVGAVIVPAVQSPQPVIREAGMACLGLAALLDRDLATAHAGLFRTAATNVGESPAIRATALRALCDLMLVCDAAWFAGDSGFTFAAGVDTLAELVRGGGGFNDDDDADEDASDDGEGGGGAKAAIAGVLRMAAAAQLQHIASEGLAKLCLAGRQGGGDARAADLVVPLLEAYFFAGSEAQSVAAGDARGAALAATPEEEDEAVANAESSVNRLKQVLSVFFPAFASSPRGRRAVAAAAHAALRGAMAACRVVSDARALAAAEATATAARRTRRAATRASKRPSVSRDALELFDRVVQYLVFLLAPADGDSGDDAGEDAGAHHAALGTALLTEVCADATGPFLRALAKGAAALRVPAGAGGAAVPMATLLDDALEDVTDSVAAKNLAKCRAALPASAAAAEAGEGGGDGGDGDGDAAAALRAAREGVRERCVELASAEATHTQLSTAVATGQRLSTDSKRVSTDGKRLSTGSKRASTGSKRASTGSRSSRARAATDSQPEAAAAGADGADDAEEDAENAPLDAPGAGTAAKKAGEPERRARRSRGKEASHVDAVLAEIDDMLDD